MKRKVNQIIKHVRRYHFELKHLLVIVVVLISFLTLVSFINKISIQNLLFRTQKWYQQDSAERLANLTATSLELLIETALNVELNTEVERENIIMALNIILNQQKLQQNVEEVCIFLPLKDSIYTIDDGTQLFEFFYYHNDGVLTSKPIYKKAVELYKTEIYPLHLKNEVIISKKENDRTFHVYVPFVPKGEYLGAIYMKNTPDFSFITHEIIASYDETAFIFAALIILGLMAMFYISSYTVKERDEAQQLLFKEREAHLREMINREKEELFTKRIYHTHHKAEKVMGFIKEDLRILNSENLAEVKNRIISYANFVSRVIYDMKWYDPPIQTIRNPLFNTNVNNVIRFIVDNLFLRTSRGTRASFNLMLDEKFPIIHINEFVIWEILEPLIQNCIEHSGKENVIITIKTSVCRDEKLASIFIEDNGNGFKEELLEVDSTGRKKVFIEHSTTKSDWQNAGYGCYIAYEMATGRCGWKLDAENKPEGGARFIITFKI
jgi:signal transduction histidine kinase